jgi:hypothetical protein
VPQWTGAVSRSIEATYARDQAAAAEFARVQATAKLIPAQIPVFDKANAAKLNAYLTQANVVPVIKNPPPRVNKVVASGVDLKSEPVAPLQKAVDASVTSTLKTTDKKIAEYEKTKVYGSEPNQDNLRAKLLVNAKLDLASIIKTGKGRNFKKRVAAPCSTYKFCQACVSATESCVWWIGDDAGLPRCREQTEERLIARASNGKPLVVAKFSEYTVGSDKQDNIRKFKNENCCFPARLNFVVEPPIKKSNENGEGAVGYIEETHTYVYDKEEMIKRLKYFGALFDTSQTFSNFAETAQPEGCAWTREVPATVAAAKAADPVANFVCSR